MPTKEEQDRADRLRAEAEAAEKAERDREREKARVAKEKAAAEEQERVDIERGYRKRLLANGTTDFVALHDQWSNPDESQVIEHVTDYRNKARGFIV